MHEVHAPGLMATARCRHGAAGQAEPLLPAGAQAHLQAFQAIEAMHPLLVVWPALAPEHDPDADVPEPRARLRQLADTHPQGRRIARARFVIPRVGTDVAEHTGAPAAHLKPVVYPLGQRAAARWP